MLAAHEGDDRSLDWLRARFGLDPVDLDIILVALAPELDARYERLYGYLQDDVTRRRPTVDLALNLLSSTPESRLLLRQRFASDAPLLKHGLVSLVPDPHQVEPTLLTHYIRLDRHLEHRLLGLPGLAPNLVGWCEWTPEAGARSADPEDAMVARLTPTVRLALAGGHPLCVYLMGAPGVGKRLAAQQAAHACGVPLLAADLTQVSGQDGPARLAGAFLATTMEDAILYLSPVDTLRATEQRRNLRALLELLSGHPGVVFLAGVEPWPTPRDGPLGVVQISIDKPGVDTRRELWRRQLSTRGLRFSEADLIELGDRFALNRRQIEDAAALAAFEPDNRSRASGALRERLFGAARAQSGYELSAVATKVEPRATWDDLVLPPKALTQLREICQRVEHRECVLHKWGFARKSNRGIGINALFAGSSGTGKTMAAEVIASALGLDLYRVDLARVVSKYIGETEKNLERVFLAAADSNAILFFDEADALFGKRSEVRDAHDRYSNIELSFLLQRMEEYDGIAILATNLKQNLDEAFARRVAITIDFPFPDEEHRRRIWQAVWPQDLVLDPDVDFAALARSFKLSGGNIRNAAFAAAFGAAARGRPVAMVDLVCAIDAEYEKMGRQAPRLQAGVEAQAA